MFLINHLVREIEHRRRYRQADCAGGLQIDDELEFVRLLDRNVGGLGACSSAPIGNMRELSYAFCAKKSQ